MATATASEPMIRMAAERSYTLLSAFIESCRLDSREGRKYAAYARAAGRDAPLREMTVARAVYIAGSRAQAIEDLRAAVAFEVSVQAQRGFLKMLKAHFDLDVPNNDRAIDALVEAGIYMLGEPDAVAAQLADFHEAAGGFGTLLIVGGKAWATREKREASMRSFMAHVAPQLRGLDAA